MACAPWLPPKTSRVGSPICGFCGYFEESLAHRNARHSQWRKYRPVSSKWTAAPETHRATSRLAKPGTKLGSNTSVGMRLQDGSQHGRAGRVSADADHDVGLKLGKHAAREPAPPRQDRTASSIASPRLTFFSAPTWTSCRESGGGDEPVFDSACGSDEQHFGA